MVTGKQKKRNHSPGLVDLGMIRPLLNLLMYAMLSILAWPISASDVPKFCRATVSIEAGLNNGASLDISQPIIMEGDCEMHKVEELKPQNYGARMIPFALYIIWSEQRLSEFTHVSLQLRVQNRRRKWNFPLNFRNDII